MKVAFDTSLFRNVPLPQALDSVGGAGFNHVEIGLAHYFPHEATDEETAQTKQMLDDRGIGLAALMAIYPVSYPDEEVRQIGVKQYLRAIDRVSALGGERLAAELMGDSDKPKECTDAFRKSMREIIPALEKSGVTLCFEAHPGDFTERNKMAVDIIREMGSANLRYLYCAPHSFVLGEDVEKMVEYSRDVLGYVHLADSLRPERTFFSGRYFPKIPPHQHLIPGKGDVNLNGLVSALKRTGYDGFLTLNPFSMYDHPGEAAAESKAAVEKLLGQ